jgi:polyisoprenoid-binding protein YceI
MSTIAEQATNTGIGVWEMDPAHTLVEFSVKHMRITTVKGHFADVQGRLMLDEARPDGSSVAVEIGANSVDTRFAARDEHLRSGDFLDVEAFPTISFRSRGIEGVFAGEGDRFRVIGDLTIRGATREVVLEAEFEGRGIDPEGSERVSFSATSRIDRRDFGLTWNLALETGGVLVGNEVGLTFTVQAVRV